jgi:hypothetical protein
VLKKLVSSSSIEVPGAARAMGNWFKHPRRIHMRKGLLALFAFVALAAAGVGIWLFRAQTPPPPSAPLPVSVQRTQESERPKDPKQLQTMLDSVAVEAKRIGLEGWPALQPKDYEPLSHGEQGSPLLNLVWSNPRVMWFKNPTETNWGALCTMKDLSASKGEAKFRLVRISDVFRSPKLELPLRAEALLPNDYRPMPEWKEGQPAPIVQPNRTMIINLGVAASEDFSRMVYSPKYGVRSLLEHLKGADGLVEGFDKNAQPEFYGLAMDRKAWEGATIEIAEPDYVWFSVGNQKLVASQGDWERWKQGPSKPQK